MEFTYECLQSHQRDMLGERLYVTELIEFKVYDGMMPIEDADELNRIAKFHKRYKDSKYREEAMGFYNDARN